MDDMGGCVDLLSMLNLIIVCLMYRCMVNSVT